MVGRGTLTLRQTVRYGTDPPFDFQGIDVQLELKDHLLSNGVEYLLLQDALAFASGGRAALAWGGGGQLLLPEGRCCLPVCLGGGYHQ